jgi:hypothetical protein
MGRDAEYMLAQWGLWVRVGAGVSGYVSPCLAMMRDNVRMPSDPAPDISEDDALAIDAIVARMRKSRYSEAADCLMLYYGSNRTIHGMARVIGISRTTAVERLNAGRVYVQAMLDVRMAA